jgi:cytoskeleton-associated protein 5
MEKNAAAGRTPSSLPMPTPPPSALNLSSPKFTSLSPVHTNTLNEVKSVNPKVEPPTSFSLPPSSYVEDDRSVNAMMSRGISPDQSDFRQHIPAGVTGGTLDAIRERMKSIQLAAGGVNLDPGSRPLMNLNGNLNLGLPSQFSHSTDFSSLENPAHSGVLPMDEKALSGLQARMERLKSGSIEPL